MGYRNICYIIRIYIYIHDTCKLCRLYTISLEGAFYVYNLGCSLPFKDQDDMTFLGSGIPSRPSLSRIDGLNPIPIIGL